MPGFFSQVFDGGSAAQSYEGQHHFGLEHATDVDQDIGVHTDVTVSFQGADGSTQTLESSHDLDATLGVHTLTAVAVDMADGLGGSSAG